MGSEKYSCENEFDKYISQHGGTSNASTDYETVCNTINTNYSSLVFVYLYLAPPNMSSKEVSFPFFSANCYNIVSKWRSPL